MGQAAGTLDRDVSRVTADICLGIGLIEGCNKTRVRKVIIIVRNVQFVIASNNPLQKKRDNER